MLAPFVVKLNAEYIILKLAEQRLSLSGYRFGQSLQIKASGEAGWLSKQRKRSHADGSCQ